MDERLLLDMKAFALDVDCVLLSLCGSPIHGHKLEQKQFCAPTMDEVRAHFSDHPAALIQAHFVRGDEADWFEVDYLDLKLQFGGPSLLPTTTV